MFRVTHNLTNVAVLLFTDDLCATNPEFQSQMSVLYKSSFFLQVANTLFSVFLSSPFRDGIVGIKPVKLFLEMNTIMQIGA